jgi:serine/threonine protein kinase
MEYVHGEDLGRLVATGCDNGVPLSLDGAVTVAAGLCAGLHDAHEEAVPEGKPLGVVHRDGSPASVLVSYDGAVKLVDSGIARAGTPSASSQTGLKERSRVRSGGSQPSQQPVMAVGQPGSRPSQPVMAVAQSRMSGGDPGSRPSPPVMSGGDPGRRPSQPVMAGGQPGRRSSQLAMARGQSRMSGGDLGRQPSQSAMVGGDLGRRPSQPAMAGRVEYVEW